MPSESVTTPRSASYRRSPLPILVTAVALATTAIGLTIIVVQQGGPTGVDATWLHWIVGHRNGTLTAVAVAVSDFGDTASMAGIAILTCAVLAWWRQWQNLLLVAGSSAGAAVLVIVGK